MPKALEHIRRMRGGAQAQLLRCDDGQYYVVKFQNNPQHVRVLANELLGTRLAARLGLPTASAAVVEVSQELIAYSADLVIQLGAGRYPCRAGFHFGSRYPGDPRDLAVNDFLPEEQLGQVENLEDFVGILVFDKWTCNTNGRQAIFYRDGGTTTFRALMIDQGFCFNNGSWDFPDAPLRGLYARHRVYGSVRGMNAFEPWLERLEKRINELVMDEIAAEIPPEWYDFEQDMMFSLLERLLNRRKRVADWILEAKDSYRQPFLNWK
ncbi:MAG TPA: HipA family kinase [Candidatus Acidoferrales bacterium]|nr:HipA family kinase [Candidatus Acidoferrales bacterium]